MDQQSIDIINWTNWYRSNYRKGARRLRMVLDDGTLYATLASSFEALSAVLGVFDKGSCAMMEQVRSSGKGDDLAVAYAGAAGHADLEALLSSASAGVLANLGLMSDALFAAVFDDADRAASVCSDEYVIGRLMESEFAMGLLAESSSAMSAIADTERIRDVVRSKSMMSMLASSSTAMTAMASSANAMEAMAGSDIALNAVCKSSAARTAWMKSSYAHTYYDAVYETLHSAPDSLFAKYETYYNAAIDGNDVDDSGQVSRTYTFYTNASGGFTNTTVTSASHSGAVAIEGIVLLNQYGALGSGTKTYYGSSQTKANVITGSSTELANAKKVLVGGMSYYSGSSSDRSYYFKASFATYVAI